MIGRTGALSPEEIEQESGRQFCPSAATTLLEVLRAQDEQIRRAAAEREPQVAGTV